MPQRVINLWLVAVGIAGLVLVAALVLFGADLRRASRTGPRWKRRLLTAALALLSGVSAGLAGRAVARSAAAQPARTSTGTDTVATKSPLAETPQWKRLTATWKEADDVASGRRGPYPFDQKGKKALLDALAARADDIDALAPKDLLSQPEAELLKKELTRLATGVRAKRPTEMRMATCYEPMWPHARADDGLRRIADRLGLLAKIAEAPTIRPEVARKVLATLEADLATGGSAAYRKYLQDTAAAVDDPKRGKYAKRFMAAAHRRDAEKNLRAARALAAKIKARLAGRRPPAGGLETTAQWKAVLDAWRFAKPLADSRKSTIAQRREADTKLVAAKQAAGELAKAQAISPAEAALLAAEADTILWRIRRDPPTDSRVVCYAMRAPFPAWHSLDRLTARLPLLQGLAASGKVSPAALRKVLPTIRADLATLADPKQTNRFQATKRQQARKTTQAAKAALAKIERMLEGRK